MIEFKEFDKETELGESEIGAWGKEKFIRKAKFAQRELKALPSSKRGKIVAREITA